MSDSESLNPELRTLICNGVQYEWRRSQPGRSRKSAQRDGSPRGGRHRRRGHQPRSSTATRSRRTISSGRSASAKSKCARLQTMHEAFGRNFGASLSALLRTIVELKLTSVDQLTYSEFVFSLENPTCFNLINAAPLEGQLILDINLSLLFPIIDRLLGGGSDPGTVVRRPLTEIELRLVSRITDLFCSEMKHAWENVLELNLSIDRVESNPQLVQIVPPNEVVVLISFELTIGDARGMMNLLHSVQCDRADQHAAVVQQLGQLRQEDGDAGKHPADQRPAERCAGGSGRRPGRNEYLNLRPDRPAGGRHHRHRKRRRRPLVVSIEGQPKFHAEPGVLKGRKAVQVAEMIGEPAAKR